MICFEPVVKGLGFLEGPVVLPGGDLVVLEMDGKRMLRIGDGAVETVTTFSGGPNGAAMGPDGKVWVCNNGGIYTFMPAPMPPVEGAPLFNTPIGPLGRDLPVGYEGGSIQRVDLKLGTVETIYASTAELPLWAPDDLVFDGKGGFWFTDQGVNFPDRHLNGGLFYGKVDGSGLRKVVTIPSANGLGLSPDGKRLYVADTLFGRLWTLQVTGPGEVVTVPGVPSLLAQTLPGLQWVDSLKVEAGGQVCVGTLITGAITVFDPDQAGKFAPGDGVVDVVRWPVQDWDPFVTNLCFGGKDMQDVWVTSSGKGTLYKARWPRPGLKLAY